ncbi:flagellar motor switch protein FliM [Georgenia sp. SYP-B2076]|uniref:flagellar motor switch protein FliM n=1 Tax=Georgenia sp. SYP-B2076 TaxID=2495881 RepID=UPI001F0C14A9|nr:flagellar motor switch protein FliM [Georgenia sp. SYP-B2076]
MTVSSSVPGATRAPVAYDFRRPMTLAREHARLLEMAFETFSRHWANQLVARLRVSVSASVTGVEMRSYDEYVASLPTTTTMVLFSVEPGRRGVVQFPLDSALVWIDHMLGGPGTPGAVPTRELTEIEQQLIRELLRRTLGDLNYSFAGITALEAEFKNIQYTPEFVQAAEASTPVIIARLVLRVDDDEVPATVMVPAEGLVAAMRAGEHLDLRSREDIAEEQRQSRILEVAVQRVPVDVAVRFRPITVHPREVVQLRVGDVLTLHHPASRPLDVVVGDRVLGQAAPGAQGSRLAGMIVHVKESS